MDEFTPNTYSVARAAWVLKENEQEIKLSTKIVLVREETLDY